MTTLCLIAVLIAPAAPTPQPRVSRPGVIPLGRPIKATLLGVLWVVTLHANYDNRRDAGMYSSTFLGSKYVGNWWWEEKTRTLRIRERSITLSPSGDFTTWTIHLDKGLKGIAFSEGGRVKGSSVDFSEGR